MKITELSGVVVGIALIGALVSIGLARYRLQKKPIEIKALDPKELTQKDLEEISSTWNLLNH